MGARLSSPLFVGRREELERLRAAVLAAIDGRPTFVLVVGEAGVGKTRFVAEATTSFPSSVRTLSGGCVDVADGTLPFAPVIEALRGLAGDLPPADLDRLLGPGRADLARLMPQLEPDSSGASGTGLTYDSAQGRLFEAVLGLLSRLAAIGPVALIIEDLHWADRSTLDLLAFLVRNLQQGPFLLLGTFRSDELHRHHPLLPFVAELTRRRPLERIDLRRFDRAEVADQLASITGGRPEVPIVDRIYERSEGNPFFAEELLAAGAATSGGVPDALRDVITARIATLDESSQELLRIASAAGTRVPADLLTAVSGIDEEELMRDLRAAVEHQVLLPENDAGRNVYRFRHTLVRDAVYADLLPAERTQLHARFAAALEQTPAADRDASIAAAIAYHWYEAHEPGRALEASIRAGMAAETSWAFAEAETQYERALEIWDRGRREAVDDGLDRVDLLSRAAAAASKGAAQQAVTHIRVGIALVDPERDPERAGLLQAQLSHYCWLTGDGRGALEAAREAVRLVPSSPATVARARVTATLGQILMVEGFMESSLPICEESVAVARAVGAREVEGHALNSLGTDIGYLRDLDGGLAHLQEAQAIAREVGNVDDVARAYANMVVLLNAAGLYERAAGLAIEAFDSDERHGLARFYGASALCEGAMALFRLGRWSEADAILAQLDRYRLSGNPETFINQRLAALEIGRGAFDAAQRRLAFVAGLLGKAIDPQWTVPFAELRAELAIWQDRLSDTIRAVEDGIATISRLSVIVPGQICRVGPLYSLGLRAEADLAALAPTRRAKGKLREHREGGDTYLTALRDMHEAIRRQLSAYVPLAAGYRALAEAEAARLHGTADPELWAAAAAAWERTGMRPARAYALWRQAEAMLAATRARVPAGAVLREAHAIASELGAAPLRQRLENLAGRARIEIEAQPTPASGHAGWARSPLTARELEVLSLVAAGRTNRQIGTALFIGENTAGVHVSNILGKLGAAGRTEAVAIARRRGLLATEPAGDP